MGVPMSSEDTMIQLGESYLDDEYAVTPVIPVDYIMHTDTYPFCFDPTCSCHEDPVLLAPVYQAYQDGELTAEEATDFINGKMIPAGVAMNTTRRWTHEVKATV